MVVGYHQHSYFLTYDKLRVNRHDFRRRTIRRLSIRRSCCVCKQTTTQDCQAVVVVVID